MDGRNFRIFLEENELDTNTIKSFLSKLKEYENYLKNHEEPEEIEYYLCGPPLMIDAGNCTA